MKKTLIAICIVLLPVLAFMFSGKGSNPPVQHEVQWADIPTKNFFYAVCADCHSHETRWPWYSRFAPASWLLQGHVKEGRSHFNISVFPMGEAQKASKEYSEGKMPPWDYRMLHPQARLLPEEAERFVSGLKITFGEQAQGEDNQEGHEGNHSHDHDD